jgi:hypothetical protein
LRPAISSVLQQISALVCDTPFLVARRYKLLFRMGQQLRRKTDLQGALSFYADCRYVGARLRQIRVLERLGQQEKAYASASQAADAPERDRRARPGASGAPTASV